MGGGSMHIQCGTFGLHEGPLYRLWTNQTDSLPLSDLAHRESLFRKTPRPWRRSWWGSWFAQEGTTLIYHWTSGAASMIQSVLMRGTGVTSHWHVSPSIGERGDSGSPPPPFSQRATDQWATSCSPPSSLQQLTRSLMDSTFSSRFLFLVIHHLW